MGSFEKGARLLPPALPPVTDPEYFAKTGKVAASTVTKL